MEYNSSPLRVRQELPTVFHTNVSTPSHKVAWKGLLKGQHDTITPGILFLLNADLAVNHRHDPITKL